MNYLKGRPVSSLEEARASQIDLDGSLYLFPDVVNKKIYTKQLNLDGSVSFNVFEMTVPVETPSVQTYVTKAELDDILASFKASLLQDKPAEINSTHKNQVNKTFNL